MNNFLSRLCNENVNGLKRKGFNIIVVKLSRPITVLVRNVNIHQSSCLSQGDAWSFEAAFVDLNQSQAII